MKNLFSYPNHIREKSSLEITEAEITTYGRSQNLNHSYPRHISQWETKSHRNINSVVSQGGYTPKVCQISTYQTQTTTNLALNILKYQLSDRQAKQKHLENIRRNLERRLQVAKAQGNNQLVNILQEEFRQLQTSI